jgi:hypothetical protein
LLKDEPNKLTSALTALITDLALFLNVGKQMNIAQIMETVELVKTEYYFLNLADLQLCFKNIKKGKYGQLYDRLDGQIIMNFIQQYSDERIFVGENIMQKTTSEMIALEKGDPDYCVMIGEKYLCLLEEGFKETKIKEMATRFEMAEAKHYKAELINNYYSGEPDKVKIQWYNKGGGLMDYLKANRPDLVPEEKEVRKQNRYPYALMVEEIHKDSTLTEMDKENKIRALSGLLPLTEQDFEIRENVK